MKVGEDEGDGVSEDVGVGVGVTDSV